MRKGTKYTVQALVKTLAWEVTPKQRSGFSGISQRMTLCMLSKSKTVGDDLQQTDYENDDYQWLPAKFKNDLVLEMFADSGVEVVECVVQRAWGFPPRSKC